MAPKEHQPRAEQMAAMSMRVLPRIAQRICVWFSLKTGDPPSVSHRKIQQVFKQGAYSKATVYRWHKDFREGRSKVGDLFRGGRKTARTDDNMIACAKVLDSDRRASVDHLAKEVGISHGSMHTMLTLNLKLKKRCAKLIPHELTDKNRRDRLQFCHEILSQHTHDPRCMQWVMTTDESWVHLWDPRSKQGNMEWLAADENRGQVIRREQSVKKLMLIPFFDAKGLVHWEMFHNQTINKHVFNALIIRVRRSLRLRRSKIWNNIDQYLIHMDNASPHRSNIVRGTLQSMNWSILKHPPYSPDLSPADFFLFPRLKKRLKGIQFHTLEALREQVDTELGLIASWEWKKCFDDWIKRCQKCIVFKGRYFEGMKSKP